MSIRKFLSELDIDQLKVAINVANEFLDQATRGEKIKIECVSFSGGRKSFFDREKAKKFFADKAIEESERSRPEIELYRDYIYESQLKDYFSKEEIAEYKTTKN